MPSLSPSLCSLCIGLEWDADGSTLAILQGGPISTTGGGAGAASGGGILLWEFDSKTVESIDLPSHIRDPTFIKWSKTLNPINPIPQANMTGGVAVGVAAGGAGGAVAGMSGAVATATGVTSGGASTIVPTLVANAAAGVVSGPQLAIGTARGDVMLYDKVTRSLWFAHAKHRKRVTCGDWNSEGKFAFASDDRQITIATGDGKTFGQVKVKSRPTNVKV